MSRRISIGIDPRCSIVWNEMQRVLSSSYGATIAPVGQRSIQARQRPQLRSRGASGSSSRSSKQLAEQDPGSEAGHDDAGVLAIPAKSRTTGYRAIDDAGGIDQQARFDRSSGPILDASQQLGHAPFEDYVIVRAPGVASNSSSKLSIVGKLRHRLVVRQPD